MGLLYVHDFGEELRRLGATAFERHHDTPVLVVRGRAGQLADGTQSDGGAGTQVSTPGNLDPRDLVLLERVFPIAKGRGRADGEAVTLGRTIVNDIVIADASVSKRHCTFEVGPGRVHVKDAGSRNGTQVDGMRLETGNPTPLRDGVLIVIGRFAVTFHTATGFIDFLEKKEATERGRR